MDVNQTRFHLVYGKAEWLPAHGGAVSPAEEPQLDWSDTDATLTLHQELFVFPRPSGQKPLAVEARRGAGRDRYGNWYWIGEGRDELHFLGAAATASEHFWSAADVAPDCPPDPSGDFFTLMSQPPPVLIMSGLGVTTDHYLVVGLVEPKGLLIFDLHSGGPPVQFLWPAKIPFAPFDIAPAADGGVWILDRSNKTYWGLDPYFRVRASHATAGPASASAGDLEPVGGEAAKEQVPCNTSQVTADLAISLAGLADPVAIEEGSAGDVLILDDPPDALFSVVYRYSSGLQTAPAYALNHALAGYLVEPSAPDNPQPEALRGYDFAVVHRQDGQPNQPGTTVCIAGIEGEQVFAFDLKATQGSIALDLLPKYFPMRKFGGKALVSAGASVYYDFEDRWWPLVEQPRARYRTGASLRLPLSPPGGESQEAGAAFDGQQPGCVWHRVLLDACIPPGAEVTVASRAADSPALLAATSWQPEPVPYLRGDGPEIPFYKPPLSGTADRVGSWELLLQNARGRYLQLQLGLRGTGRNTPRLHALRIYYPRFSYLHQYLPAVYRDDSGSASFLDRYLSNVEGFYTVLEGKIEQVQTLFDTRTIPAEYLDWLAGWVGIALDMNWSARTRRLVLSHAAQMFRHRGTRAGLIRAIRLGLDPCPDESLFDSLSCRGYDCPRDKVQAHFTVRVVERFLTRSAPGVVYGDPTDVLGPGSTTTLLEWTPAQGAEILHRRFRGHLRAHYGTIESLNTAWDTHYLDFDDAKLQLAPVQPSHRMQASDWQRFLRGDLGFTYDAVTAADTELYQRFLARQHRDIADLNAAYNPTGAGAWASFGSVQLPDALPPGGQRLQDWIQFVSLVLPAHRNAHRFTVLVPVTLNDDPDTQLKKLGVAQRIADLEKPAHTAFDVRLYWGMFRVGEARVGLDTLLGRGSRSVALILGRGYLAGGHLRLPESDRARGRMGMGGGYAAQPGCRNKPQERCT